MHAKLPRRSFLTSSATAALGLGLTGGTAADQPRSVGGDFYAHASYRVTGYAVPMGEAAGAAAALAASTNRLPRDVPWQEIQATL